jgi:hypothetical protein
VGRASSPGRVGRARRAIGEMRLARWARSALGELFGVAVRVGRGLGKGTANGVFFRRPSVQPTQIKLLSSGRRKLGYFCQFFNSRPKLILSMKIEYFSILLAPH